MIGHGAHQRATAGKIAAKALKTIGHQGGLDLIMGTRRPLFHCKPLKNRSKLQTLKLISLEKVNMEREA